MQRTRAIRFILPALSCTGTLQLCFCQKERKIPPLKPFSADHSNIKPSNDTCYISHRPKSSLSGSSFSIMYDVSRRSPKWVVEHLRKPEIWVDKEQDREEMESINPRLEGSRRKKHRPSFHVEHAIEVEKFRTNANMFKNSGYDRGEQSSFDIY